MRHIYSKIGSKLTTKQWNLLLLTLLFLVAFAVIYHYHKSSHQQHDTVAVSVAAVQQKNVTIYSDAIGNVQAHATVAVKSLVDGQLIKIGFNKGDFIKSGQLLFVIDQRPFLVALQKAQASLAHDQAQLSATQLLLERNRKLITGHYISKQDFDQLQANYESLLATIKADQAQVANAALELSYCTITSPIDGRAGDTLVDIGNIVKANDQNPLVVINQITPIDIKFSIPEKQLAMIQNQLRSGAISVQAKLDAQPNSTRNGNINFIDNTVDTQTGMIRLNASFANSDNYFWPGQFAHITLPLMHLSQALVIPTRAVQMGQNGPYVFAIIKNKTVAIKPINLGSTIGDQTVINQGLKAGELVVTEGLLNLTAGTRIHVQQTTSS